MAQTAITEPFVTESKLMPFILQITLIAIKTSNTTAVMAAALKKRFITSYLLSLRLYIHRKIVYQEKQQFFQKSHKTPHFLNKRIFPLQGTHLFIIFAKQNLIQRIIYSIIMEDNPERRNILKCCCLFFSYPLLFVTCDPNA